MGGDNWDESDHPRESNGEFGSGGNGAPKAADAHDRMDKAASKAGEHRDVPKLAHDQRIQNRVARETRAAEARNAAKDARAVRTVNAKAAARDFASKVPRSAKDMRIREQVARSGDNGYNKESVNKAINNASRYQGKVSGREANAIHRLLKGRH